MSRPKPLTGFIVLEEWADDYSFWSGQIAYPNPQGTNLYWEKTIEMIEKSAYDTLKAEVGRLKTALRTCRNEMQYRIWQIETGHLAPTTDHFINGEMYRAVEMADEALGIASKKAGR